MTFLSSTQLSAPYGPTYVENVFSTYVYTGNGAARSITNNINVLGEGGLVWVHCRSNAQNHKLVDTVRGATKSIVSSATLAQATEANGVTDFSYTGFSLGTDTLYNNNTYTYVSWTFRRQQKFFDIVTYTGTGVATTIPHQLNSVPGCIIVKRTDTTANWQVYHVGLTSASYAIRFNLSGAQASDTTIWNGTAPTDAVFSVGTDATVNAAGGTYVAYIFANNAGGFGASGTDNIVTCGTYTGGGASSATVTLGYEPQWILVKARTAPATGTASWGIQDNIRGFTITGTGATPVQFPNDSSTLESTVNGLLTITPTGFVSNTGGQFDSSGTVYFYVAIRRGPMATPISASTVFTPSVRAGTGASGASTALGSVADLIVTKQRGSTQTWAWTDRLRWNTYELTSVSTAVQTAYTNDVTGLDSMTGFTFGTGTSGQINTSGSNYVDYLFSRAPGFFDQVKYVGTGAATTVTHNLGVAPEMMIVKRYAVTTGNWAVYHVGLGAGFFILLDGSSTPTAGANYWNSTAPTATVFSLSNSSNVNASGGAYTAYLFASCPGVCKVGSYVGNGGTQTIDCGFPNGARFVITRKTSGTGNWNVFDTARGMVAGTDPYLQMDGAVAETNANSVYSVPTGFQLVSSLANAGSANYIYIAIA